MAEGTGEKTNKQPIPVPQDPTTSDQPFSQEHIDELSDLIADPEVPDEDTGTFKMPPSSD
ncbi:MAG TPA: hypothetical protein VJ521_10760 [Acidobacteriota bacterium]|nr:hypothetical protein [Acidobacteriota bacterium]